MKNSLLPIAVVTLASWIPVHGATVELITNGGFESGLTGWDASLNVLTLGDYFGITPASGSSMAVLPAAGFLDASLQQDIDTSAAVSASITFDLNLAALDLTRFTDLGTDSFTLLVGGQSIFSKSLNDLWDSSLTPTTTGWTQESAVVPLNLLNTGVFQFRFEVENVPAGAGDIGQNFVAFVDNVSVLAVVPEISSPMPWLFAGLACVIARRRLGGRRSS